MGIYSPDTRQLIGPVLKIGVPERSGLIYPLDVMEKAVDLFQSKLPAFGIIGVDERLKLENASHTIDSVWIDKDTIMASGTILKTLKGIVLDRLLKEADYTSHLSDYRFCMVSRGSIHNRETVYICEISYISVVQEDHPVMEIPPDPPRSLD